MMEYDLGSSMTRSNFVLETLLTLQMVTAGKGIFLSGYRLESSDMRTGESTHLFHICQQK